MARGYEPEEFIGPREVSEERERKAQQPSRDDESRDQVREERAHGAGSHTASGAARSPELRQVYEIRCRTYRLRTSDITTMLEAVGVGSIDELVDRAVPDTIREHAPLALPAGLTEAETLAFIEQRRLMGLVLSAVFVPCAFISGITGQFFRQFAVTIAISTVISAFNSLTLSPALAAILLKPHGTRRDNSTSRKSRELLESPK